MPRRNPTAADDLTIVLKYGHRNKTGRPIRLGLTWVFSRNFRNAIGDNTIEKISAQFRDSFNRFWRRFVRRHVTTPS